MASPLEGKNAILKALKGPAYELMGCASSVSFTCETELIRKTGPNSAGYREYAARLCDWGISLSNVSFIVKDNNFTVFELLVETLRRVGLDIELAFFDAEGNLKTITGHVLIPSISIDAPAVGFVEDSIELKGSGPFAIGTTIITPPPSTDYEVNKYEYVADTTHYSLTDPILIDREILEFSRDGVGFQVITAGTQNDKQVKYIPGMGQFNFSTPLESGEYVLILYK